MEPTDTRVKWVEKRIVGLTEGTDYQTIYDYVEFDNRKIKVKFYVSQEENQVLAPPRDATPSSNAGVPPRKTNPNKKELKNKVLEQQTKATDNATQIKQIQFDGKLPFYFSEGFNRLFLTEETVRLLSLFGDFKITKRFLDIIFEAKKKVENFRDKEYRKKGITDTLPIYGDIWDLEIEKKVKWLIFKKKEYEIKGKPIKNLEGYWFKTMEVFWQNVLNMDREEGFMRLDYLASIGELELRDSVGELEKIMSKQKIEKRKKIRELFSLVNK